MRTHRLKTWPEFFLPIAEGEKTFEVRKNDRGFRLGDVLVLREFCPVGGTFTGREERRLVVYILEGGQFGIEAGHCVLGLGRMTAFRAK
jgi:hypothetical protein